MSDTPSKPREYVGINPDGNSNALISVLIPEDFYALMGSSSHPDKIELVEKSALVAAQAEIEKLRESLFKIANAFHDSVDEKTLLKLVMEITQDARAALTGSVRK